MNLILFYFYYYFSYNYNYYNYFSSSSYYHYNYYSITACKVSGQKYYIEVHSPMNLWWSGGAMVLCKLPMPGRPTVRIRVGQGPTALAEGGGCLYFFSLIFHFPLSSLSLGDGPI